MKKVLVIGASSAIAQAVADQFAREGAQFVLWGRSQDKLDVIASNLRVRHGVVVDSDAFDLNDFSRHSSALHHALATLGSLDLAIICHGSLGDQTACETDFEVALAELRTNCLSTLALLTLLANYFEPRKSGGIVAISSVAGDRGRQSNYVYGTAKAALNVFLQGLRNRLYPSGVHVMTVKPGFVDTPMTAHMKKGLLFASPEQVARDIITALDRKACIVYTPWFWRYIMLVIKAIPERIFQTLKL